VGAGQSVRATTSAQQEGYESPGIGAGGVVFLIFLVIIGGIASVASRADWSGVGFRHGQLRIHISRLIWKQPFPAGANFKAIADHGDVVIRAWDENKVKVHVRETTPAPEKTKPPRRQVFEGNKPTLSTEGNMVTLRSGSRQEGPKIQIGFWTGPAPGKRILRSTCPAKLPPTLSLTMKRPGDVRPLADGNIKINNDHGDVSLRDITGNVEISSDHVDTSINNVTGNVRMAGGPGDSPSPASTASSPSTANGSAT